MPFDGSYRNNMRLHVLEVGRDLIKRGWCQYNFRIDTGPGQQQFCAVGAYRHAYAEAHPDITLIDAWQEADWLVLDLLAKELPFFYRLTYWPIVHRDAKAMVTGYNDTSWRRRAAILALYDKAIKRLAYS
jgi:hypothetical protein